MELEPIDLKKYYFYYKEVPNYISILEYSKYIGNNRTTKLTEETVLDTIPNNLNRFDVKLDVKLTLGCSILKIRRPLRGLLVGPLRGPYSYM